MVDLEAFIAEQLRTHPIEARIVRRVVSALRKAGTPVVAVWDGEERTDASTLDEINRLVFNLDEAWLMVAGDQHRDSWVRITMGNEWDALTDYTTDLEEQLKPVMDWLMEVVS